jgi:GT2 family glycosyltransferase
MSNTLLPDTYLNKTANVCAVVVTFNRCSLLKKALETYDAQTLRFSFLVIVDNASVDGTKEYLDDFEKSHPSVRVFHLPKNIGGAGGNAFGLQKAVELTACSWFFVSDDDAFLSSDLLEQFVSFRTSHPQQNGVAYASAVYHGSQLELEHRSRITKKLFRIKRSWVPAKEYQQPFFSFDLLTFVGAFFSRKAIEQVGFPDPGFFIHYDDTEYSCRLRKIGSLFCLPACKVDHQDAFGNPVKITWRTFYDVRNRAFTIRKHFGNWYYSMFKLWTLLTSTGLCGVLVKHYGHSTRSLFVKALRSSKKNGLTIDDVYNPDYHQEL